jgi:hypothetical protein
MRENYGTPPPLITDDIDFDALHPRFSRVRAYLETKTAGKRMAARHDIDPIEVPDVLAFINLIDVSWSEPEVPRFRFRLLGTRQIRYAGGDFTGKWVEETLSGSSASAAIAAMRRVAVERRPIFGRFAMPVDGREFVTTERLMFPLSPDDETVNMLLSVHNYPE